MLGADDFGGTALDRILDVLAVEAPTSLAFPRSRIITFDVLGVPAPKGSARAFIAGGKAVVAPSGSAVNRRKLKSWDTAVREQAVLAVGDCHEPPFVSTPLFVEITFRLARPAGHWLPGGRGLRKSAPHFPATKPDVDKLARSALDSLSGVVFDDDSRVTTLRVSKRYARAGRDGGAFVIRADFPHSLIAVAL